MNVIVHVDLKGKTPSCDPLVSWLALKYLTNVFYKGTNFLDYLTVLSSACMVKDTVTSHYLTTLLFWPKASRRLHSNYKLLDQIENIQLEIRWSRWHYGFCKIMEPILSGWNDIRSHTLIDVPKKGITTSLHFLAHKDSLLGRANEENLMILIRGTTKRGQASFTNVRIHSSYYDL